MKGPLALTARRWVYRRWHTLALFALATVVMATAALGPCYARAVQEATVRTSLADAPVTESGVSVSIGPGVPANTVLPPGDPTRFFTTPIIETELASSFVLDHREYQTNLVSRDDVCQHLTMVAGRCAIGTGAVVASASTARVLGLHVGQEVQLSAPFVASADLKARIVGLYTPFNASEPYWFGRSYLSSTAGLSVQKDDGGGGKNVLDAFFGSPTWLTTVTAEAVSGAIPGSGNAPIVAADALLIISRVRLGDLPALKSAVTQISSLTSSGTDSVTTGLPALVDHLTDGFGQAATVERVLTVQLVVLALIAFAVIVAAAAGQRSRELALARLRGRSPLRVAWQFGGEIAGVVLLAFVPALALALGLTALAGHWWLGTGATAELLLPVVLAAVAAGLVALATTAVVGWRSSRRPISELLREIPAARPAVAVGALEAGVATLTAAGLYLAFSGNSGTSNGISLLTPMLMAALAGLLVGRVLVVVARPVSGWAWRRRRLTFALAAASLGRRTGYRLAASVLCISAALVVFAGQQGSVSTANRSARAAAETGAAVVLDVNAANTGTLLDTVRSVDPNGSYATVVALPVTFDQAPMVAVDSRSFARIASWGRAGERPSDSQLAALQPHGTAPPVSFTATNLTLRLTDLSRRTVGNTALNAALARPLGPVFLELVFVRASGGTTTASFGPLPSSARTLSLATQVDCGGGCSLRGLALNRDTLDPNQIEVSTVISGLSTDAGRAVSLGGSGQWQSTTPATALVGADGSTRSQLLGVPGGLQFTAIDVGGVASAQYLAEPVALPALYAGSIDSSTDPLNYQVAPGLDGSPLRIRPVGHIAFVPRIGSPAILVDLGGAAAAAEQLSADTQVWLGRDDPGREQRLRQALAADGMQITSRDTAASAREGYAHAAPALGAYLTVAVAVLAALVAIALLVLTVGATWRSRLRDREALRLLGVRRRTVRGATALELVTVVSISTAIGAAVGMVGARLILPKLPLFAGPPAVPIPERIAVQWPWFAGLTLGLLAMLLVAVGLIAQRAAAGPAVASR